MDKTSLDYIERTPLNGEKPKKLVIFLHGYGSNKDDLIELTPNFSDILPDAQFISVNAPDKFEGIETENAFQWFSLRVIDYLFIKPKIQRAHKILNKFIDEQLNKFGLSNKNLILMGFSQGAMMALYTGLQRESELMGIIAFSGALAYTTFNLKKRIKSKPRIFLIHGLKDEVVPYFYFRHAKKLLQKFKLPFEHHTIQEMNHGINQEAIDKARAFISKIKSGK